MKEKKAIVWISVVLYTLIGLAVISLMLAVIRPKIAEIKDATIIDQTVKMLNDFDSVIQRARQATGTRLSYRLQLNRGEFIIDPNTDSVQWILEDSSVMYSEPGEKYSVGNINYITEKYSGKYKVTLSLDYTINITSDKIDDVNKTLHSSKNPYKLWVENIGGGVIDVSVE